jgi:hypothetical protein
MSYIVYRIYILYRPVIEIEESASRQILDLSCNLDPIDRKIPPVLLSEAVDFR